MPMDINTVTKSNPNTVALTVALLTPMMLIGFVVTMVMWIWMRHRIRRKDSNKLNMKNIDERKRYERRGGEGQKLLDESVDENDGPKAPSQEIKENFNIREQLSEKKKDDIRKSKDGEKCLHVTCSEGNLSMCRHMIKHYPEMLTRVDNQGWNAALYAAEEENVEILELQPKNGIDPTCKSITGRNILHIACANSNLEMCQHIIKHYPELLNQVDNDEWNAALCAAQGGNVEILELLAKSSVKLTCKNNRGGNILQIACMSSKLEMCQHIIKHYPDMLTQVDNKGWSAALYASQGGNVEILEVLAKRGVKLAHKSNYVHNILHIACGNSKLEMCQHIIKHYPELLNQVDNDGWNAALCAAQGGNVAILELLAKYGCKVTWKNKIGNGILHIACRNSKLEMCQHVIKHYPEMLNEVNNEGWNTALCAAKGGNVEILELLAKSGVKLTHKNNYGSNILHIACANSKLEVCRYIIKYHPDMFNEIDNEGWNAALYAAQEGNVEILELLAKSNVKLTCKNNRGGNILQIACKSSKLEMCQHIIKNYPDMLTQVDNKGWSAALYASQGGNVEILEVLAKSGLKLTHKNNSGHNFLHVACGNSELEMCQHIIKYYPELLSQVDNDGWNAALCAAQGGNVAILELLAKNGCKVTWKNKIGNGILHIACRNSKLEMCQYVINHYQGMLNEVNNEGWNTALYAAKGGNVEILELLAKGGVKLTHKNNYGSNILHIACANSKLEMCRYIIKYHPDMLNQVDNEGWNAAFHAAQEGNVEILELLAKSGVELKRKNNYGSNILHIACANSKLEICRYIIKYHPDMLNQVDNEGWNAALHATKGGSVEVLELLVNPERWP